MSSKIVNKAVEELDRENASLKTEIISTKKLLKYWQDEYMREAEAHIKTLEQIININKK